MKKLLALVLLFGLGTSVYAQEGKIETGLNLSYGIPMDKDIKDGFKSSPAFGLFADYKVVDNVFVGLEYTNMSWKAKEGDEKLKEGILGLRAKYEIPVEQGINVYGILGIARYNYKWGSEKDDGIGFNLGVGAKYDVAENVFVGLDLRYHFAPKYEQEYREYDEYADEWYTEKYSAKTNHMMIGINAGYRF